MRETLRVAVKDTRFREGAAGTLALLGYFVSRWVYADLGLEPDLTPLGGFWQFLDPSLLQESPWESIYYMHIQPPLYNVYLALALRSGDFEAFTSAAHLGFGITLHVGLYGVMRGLRVHRAIAVITVWVAAFDPASPLLESWLFYTYPVAAMVTASGALLAIGTRRGNRVALVSAFLLMAAVVLTRSLFHIAWMVGAIGIVVALVHRRRRVLVCAAIPLALAASVYVKNAVVFGQPQASTWLGFSLSRLTTYRAPRRLITQMQQDGVLSELAHIRPWGPFEDYPAEYRERLDLPDVPALRDRVRSTGNRNMNHAAYIRLSEVFRDDAVAFIRARPMDYLDSVGQAWTIFFVPTHDYSFLESRRRQTDPRMRDIERVYERFFGADALAAWSFGEPKPALRQKVGWRWAVLLLCGLLCGMLVAVRGPRRDVRATAAYVVWTVVVACLVGNSFEFAETNRFRFMIQPFSWALLALMLSRGVDASIAGVRRAARWKRASCRHVIISNDLA